MVKAKIWQKGDEQGFVPSNKGIEAPYIVGIGGKYVAEFGTHYLVEHSNGTKELIPLIKFENEYELLNY